MDDIAKKRKNKKNKNDQENNEPKEQIDLMGVFTNEEPDSPPREYEVDDEPYRENN